MQDAKISVIIPIYGVEGYLAACLDSIVGQTYQNLEIILVDDASPDNCGKICDQYATEDERIRVIHRRENGGLSQARNDGIDVARGDYILFVDSDDWLSLDACEALLEGMREYQADCCVGRCVTVWERKGGLIPQKGKESPTHCDTAQEAIKKVLLKESSACNRLYHREVFASLRFPINRINEDEPMVIRAYSKMNKIVFLNRDTYFYRKRADSITTSKFSVKKLDCVYNSLENLEFVRVKAPGLAPCAEYKYIKAMLWCYVNLWKVRGDSRVPQLRKKLRADIRGCRRMALRNEYLGFPLKMLALLCGL